MIPPHACTQTHTYTLYDLVINIKYTHTCSLSLFLASACSDANGELNKAHNSMHPTYTEQKVEEIANDKDKIRQLSGTLKCLCHDHYQ